MIKILNLANISKEVQEKCREIVDTCRACREWQRPAPKNMATLRISNQFNEYVEIDLLFVGDMIILHIIDEFLRFSGGGLLKSQQTPEILRCIHFNWIMIHGPPRFIVSDQEGALESDEARIYFDRLGTQRRPKAVGSKAVVVERHHEIIRNSIRRIRSQCKEEGLNIEPEYIVAEAFFAHNSMLNIGGFTPYIGLYGRHPMNLVDIDSTSAAPWQDDVGGLPGLNRHVHRLREIAGTCIIGATSVARVTRALESQTRTSGVDLNLTAGTQVDVMRKVRDKDESNWIGPCTVVETSDIREGVVQCKWQGRTMPCRVSDLRLALFSELLYFLTEGSTVWRSALLEVVNFGNECTRAMVRLGWCIGADGNWTMTQATKQYPKLWQAVTHAALLLGIKQCHGARVGCGIHHMQHLAEMDSSVLVWWYKHSPSRYYSISYGNTAVAWNRIASEDERPEAYWWKIAFMQLFFTRAHTGEDDSTTAIAASADLGADEAPLQQQDVPMSVPAANPHLPPPEEERPAPVKRKADRQIGPYDPEDDDYIDAPIREAPVYRNDRHVQVSGGRSHPSGDHTQPSASTSLGPEQQPVPGDRSEDDLYYDDHGNVIDNLPETLHDYRVYLQQGGPETTSTAGKYR